MSTDAMRALDRATLARLGREYMLSAQMNSRAGYAALAMNHGPEHYKNVAIDNWMAASPVYTRRMQRAMRLRGDSDVETILKGLQLECGFSHQYFDVHFKMTGEESGEFWLPSCGPLLETEPRGEAAVKTMCHDIEDPTFDATAVATNARAQVRPIHRPPRTPVDRDPHCHWRVFVNPDADPVQERDITHEMAATELAKVELPRDEPEGTAGWDYYDGPLVEQLQLEYFSHPALLTICRELAVQVHLLVGSLGLAAQQRFGEAAAADIARFQLTGAGWVTSERLARSLGVQGDGIDAIVEVLRLHPAFAPQEYFNVEVRNDASGACLVMHESPATRETRPLGWYPLYSEDDPSALEAVVQGVNPRARLRPTGDPSARWEIVLADTAAEEPLAVQIVKGTVLYSTRLEDHVQLLQVG